MSSITNAAQSVAAALLILRMLATVVIGVPPIDPKIQTGLLLGLCLLLFQRPRS